MDSDKEQSKTESVTTEKQKSETSAPTELSDLTDVPDIDPNAPLKIEQIKKTNSSPAPAGSTYKTGEQDQAEETDKQEKSNKKLYIYGGVVLGLIVILTLGFFLFSGKQIKEEENPVPQEQTSPTPKPTETPKKVLNREEWSFEVLNGSGVSGAAKKIADKLATLGYPVLKTGNADQDDYKNTQIFVKIDLKDKVDLVIADLKDIVKVASFGGELKDSTVSARIILGKYL